jgi:hypothetical protein
VEGTSPQETKALSCRAWRFGGLVCYVPARCRRMMHYNELASMPVSSPMPDADRLWLAVATYLSGSRALPRPNPL